MNNETKGTIAITALSILWGTAAVAIRAISNYGIDVPTQLFFGAIAGCLFILAIYGKKVELKPKKENLKWLVLLGMLSSITVITFFYAAVFTKIAYLEFLHYTMPVWVFLLAAFWLKERITSWKLLALVLAIIGISLIFHGGLRDGLDLTNFGNILALVSAFSYAGMTVIGRKLKDVEQQSSVFWTFFIGIFFSLPLFILDGELSVLGIILISMYTLVEGIGGYLLYFYALRNIEASKASIILLIETVFASFFAWIFFGETVTALAFIGGAFILTGSAIVIKKTKWSI